MAILDEVPGVKIEISVGTDSTKVTREYVDEDCEDSEDHVVRYIESTAGARFAIKVTYGAGYPYTHDCTIVNVNLDGTPVKGRVCMKNEYRKKPIYVLTGAATFGKDLTEERAFMFADVVTSDTIGDKRCTRDISNLGIISVRLQRAVLDPRPSTGPPKKPKAQADPGVELDNSPIPEKKMKGFGISHQTTLGETKLISQRPCPIIYPYGKDPFAIFDFKYRSRASLQALCLIPRSPSPVPLEDRPVEDLGVSELQELVRQQKKRLDDNIRIKKEKQRKRRHTSRDDDDDDDDDDSNDEVVVTEQRPTKARKICEVIDLTDD